MLFLIEDPEQHILGAQPAGNLLADDVEQRMVILGRAQCSCELRDLDDVISVLHQTIEVDRRKGLLTCLENTAKGVQLRTLRPA